MKSMLFLPICVCVAFAGFQAFATFHNSAPAVLLLKSEMAEIRGASCSNTGPDNPACGCKNQICKLTDQTVPLCRRIVSENMNACKSVANSGTNCRAESAGGTCGQTFDGAPTPPVQEGGTPTCAVTGCTVAGNCGDNKFKIFVDPCPG